jgi:hypothetical protein
VQFLYLTTLEMPWTTEYFPRVRRAHKLPVVLSQEKCWPFSTTSLASNTVPP